MSRASWVAVVVVFFSFIVSADVLIPPSALQMRTSWGNPSIKLQLTFNPAFDKYEIKKGRIEFDCAHGFLDRIVSDNAAGFLGVGTFTQEGGPVMPHPESRSQKAKYFGYVFGNNKMNLILVLENDPEHPLSFLLQRNFNTVLHKCL